MNRNNWSSILKSNDNLNIPHYNICRASVTGILTTSNSNSRLTLEYSIHQAGVVWCLICCHSSCLFFPSKSWSLLCFQSPGHFQLSKVILSIGSCQRYPQRRLCSLKVRAFIDETGNLLPYFLLVLWSIVLGSGMQNLSYFDHYVCRC